MPKSYIKVFIDLQDSLEPLDDAARGRLFTALLKYARTGNAPELPGNERFLFPMIKAQLDRDAASYEVRCEANRANGARGGRPRKGASETEKSQEKEKEKDKDKDKDKDSSLGARAPGERKSWRKKTPGPRADAPETVAADMKRMERFLLELRREAAEQDRRLEEGRPVDRPGPVC